MKLWLLVALALLLVIGLATIVGRKAALRLIRERRLRVDRFKLGRKIGEIEEAVFRSKAVRSAIEDYAAGHGLSTAAAEIQARRYLREIVPKFNLLAYYRFGAPIARAILYFLYWIVVDRETLQRFNASIHRKTTVIYLINHRSNVDYVLVAHMLFKFISLSYAVGEWARVWPLNHLFKWFGAYFIRRNFREPLYHAVLSAYVTTITSRGVTQGVFLEGGLSRDGLFRKPKLGMLDYIVGSKRDPSFTDPLVLIPTAINYDRVLEDRVLTRELLGREERASRLQQLRESFTYLFKSSLRSIFGRFRRYGHAVVSFGEPIVVDDFIREHPGLLAEDWDERKPSLMLLAESVMREISRRFPVTPVTLVANVFCENPDRALTREDLRREIAIRLDRMDDRFLYEPSPDPEKVWEEARRVLELRRLISEEPEGWRWSSSEILLRDYYANALTPFDEAMQIRRTTDAEIHSRAQ